LLPLVGIMAIHLGGEAALRPLLAGRAAATAELNREVMLKNAAQQTKHRNARGAIPATTAAIRSQRQEYQDRLQSSQDERERR
jgi:hypothetical protein